ncbi:protein ecdysoneless [Thrips palmi]|uniref:Protein ecdysoneless n=1 Tax=Thrips palmi TaxID=161013 RepID=A0A6P8ZZ61_THRPL|nr:protein ecdysoneless [Thrips palmi]
MASALEDVQVDDFVEYFLFPQGLEELSSKEEVEDSLRNVFSLISCCSSEHKREYIWHKDPFNIAPILEDETGLLPPHLHGTTHFGDNIEDEWFIVYLLLQLTKDVEGLVVRVIDSDGEFLLIEAADYLPPWADPETCGQRVYLYQGEVHLIPYNDLKMNDSPKVVAISSAIQLIRSSPQQTLAPQPIQDAISARIEGYPNKIKENLHRTTLSLPAEISVLLKHNPSLIAPAVRAFCERDPIDKRACRNMTHFRPENCVMSSVVFTRCLYAMLCHEKSIPEKRSGWQLPPPNSPTFKMYNLGYKVACGFEILVDRAKTSGNCSDSTGNTPSVEIKDLAESRGWSLYLSSLRKKEYFKGLLEGSKEYNALLEQAKEFYINNCASTSKIMPDSSAGSEILSRLHSLTLDLEAMKEESKNLPQNDDDSWLEIGPEEVDKMLKERYGSITDKLKKSEVPDKTGLATALGNFMDCMSGVDGAEFPKQGTSKTSANNPIFSGTRKKSGKNSEDSEMAASDNRLNFDPEGFSCAVQNILDFVIPEDSWDLNSGSEDSDIGSYEDDGELDLDEVKPGKKQPPDAELKQYMDQMDRELANTTIAQSFEKKEPKAKPEKKIKPGTSQDEDLFEDVEDFQPVDIDLNALKNILESFQSQMGAAGPASNLLGPMGIHLENMSRKTSDNNGK